MEFIIENARVAGDPAFMFESQICRGRQGTVIAPPHIHDYVEMLFCRSGVCQIDLSDAAFYISSGDLIVINSNAIHKVTAIAKEVSEYIVVKFKPEIIYSLEQAVNEFQYVFFFLKQNPTHNIVVRDADLLDSGVPQHVMAIYEEFINKEFGYEVAVKGHLLSMVVWLLRYWHNGSEESGVRFDMSTVTYVLLDKVFKYVDQHYSDDISIAAVADFCGMNGKAFSKFFRKYMGKSFLDYLNSTRIRAAERLLIFTMRHITDIAYEVGFSTTSYFIQQFKANNGITPLTFRKRFLDNKDYYGSEKSDLPSDRRKTDQEAYDPVSLSLLSDVAPKMNW
ncbi:AraC family transcriptional regulator [Clostridia bacterium]|nr:AraC family transcriptional regulator [Clostridia bacterium]